MTPCLQVESMRCLPIRADVVTMQEPSADGDVIRLVSTGGGQPFAAFATGAVREPNRVSGLFEAEAVKAIGALHAAGQWNPSLVAHHKAPGSRFAAIRRLRTSCIDHRFGPGATAWCESGRGCQNFNSVRCVDQARLESHPQERGQSLRRSPRPSLGADLRRAVRRVVNDEMTV